MNAQQHLSDLAVTLGLPALEFNASGCARLLFDETIAVNFEHNDTEGLLTIYSSLGELPASGRESLYRSLLRGNLLGLQTQGSALAIDPELDEAVLSRTILIEEVSLESFATLLDRFIGCAEYWTRQLAERQYDASAVAPADGESPAFSRPMDGNLRV